MKRAGALVAAGGVIALAALLAQRRPPDASGRGERGAPPAGASAAHEPRTPFPPAEAPASASSRPAGRARRPASLRGTRPDGHLEVDPTGHFRATPAARAFFDYWLSASGEEPLESTRKRIVSGIGRQLPPAAAREAEGLLDRYLLYRERARQLAASGLGGAGPEERLEALAALRRETLGVADAAALFADEEQRDRAALERMRILSDRARSPEERSQALAAAEAALPEPERAAHEAATLPLRLAGIESAVRAAGGDEAAVRAAREAMVGAEAAERLAALDRERADWQQRLDDFRAARAAIEGDPSRTPAERARAVEALLAARFSPVERLRVEALDRAAAPSR